MSEINKHFYIPNGIDLKEPSLNGANVSHAVDDPNPLSDLSLKEMADQFSADMVIVAPDLDSYGLAKQYAEALFEKLKGCNVKTHGDLVCAGSEEFYHIGKEVLGPLAVGFVDFALKQAEGKVILPARDATPFFYIAKTLKTLNSGKYPPKLDDISNWPFNRKLWGVNDEQEAENGVLEVTHPLVHKLLDQMAFGKSIPKTFIEVGCWGSMIPPLKTYFPGDQFTVYFLYTHLPEYIYGYSNNHGDRLPDGALETIADTWEAFPKSFKRSTNLVEHEGVVKASLEGKIVQSPLLHHWSVAALQGVVDAAKDFVSGKLVVDPQAELHKLYALSLEAQSGKFTGVLPTHTETWSEGEQWRKDWSWGKIPPLN